VGRGGAILRAMNPAPPAAPASRPIAVLSDVHGNLEALEAVLRELGRRGVTELIVLGDHLFGGPAPHEVWLRLTEVGARLLRGPSDLALATLDPAALAARADLVGDTAGRARLALFEQTRQAVGELVIARLRRLPERHRMPLLDGGEALFVHGSPAAHDVEVSHDLDDEELVALLGDDPADLVFCSGAHVPFQRDLPGTRLVGVGSVGDAPGMAASGRRVAHYVVLTPRSDGTLLEQAHVEYE
jgi:predicted phosphodiesterase